MPAATIAGYDVHNDKADACVVCPPCAEGYDVSTYRVVPQAEADEYGDHCAVCNSALWRD